MKEFFKMMFASMTGCLITVLVVFVIMFAVISGLMSGGSEEVKIQDKSVLVIELNKAITERTSDNPFDNMDFGSMSSETAMGLNNILRTIKYAATDERVSGILLDLSDVNAGFATTEAIRNQLDTFKVSGKFVVAYGDNFSQKAYYLATAANKVYLNPEGAVDFKGIYMQTMFFKNALAKLNVDVQIIRHGKFKSAVEPYLLEKMSDENRLQLQTFADGIWGHLVKEIAASRKSDTAKMNMVADSLFALNAEGALKYNIVDSLIYRDELNKLILTKSVQTGDIPYISMNDYYKGIKEKLLSYNKDRIAVIYAFGEINNGKYQHGTISGKHMSKVIREAAADSSIKAIVLRVNSPGGDALASDMIWREVYMANKIKPVVVSMGDYAASGGYYISCAARKIFAEPTTLTGSIGVFGMIPNMQKLFNEKLGITFDEVKTNQHSDYIGTMKPMNDYDRATLQFMIEDIYSTFIKHVAEGRKMKPEDVDSIGQGRIWCGTDAMRLGLVDEMGGIYDAIAYAAQAANLTEYSVEELPVQKDFLATLMEDFGSEAKVESGKIIEQELGEFAPLYEAWKKATQMSGVQARLPYFLLMD